MITSKFSLTTIGIATFSALGSLFSAGEPEDAIKPATKPNIIFILADDLGNADLGYNGCKDIETPNLDKLATTGIIFNDHHTTASVCAPSRAGIFSGVYQQKFGFECNAPHGKHGMPGSVITWAEAMQSAGYETMGLGKWHLGGTPEMHPNKQGFDHYSGFIAGGRSYFPVKNASKQHMMQRNGVQVPENEISYVTNWLTDEAIRLIDKRDQAKPFFMYLGYNAPHAPMHAREVDLQKYKHIEKKGRRTYAAMVDCLDQDIGRLHQYLAEKNLSENTMIIFTSDNGGATVNSSDNGIYRGMKGSKWEGGHRVPCIVNWPAGGFTGGKKTNAITSTLDFMATSLTMAGKQDQVTALKLDGISFLPIAKDQNAIIHSQRFGRRSAAGYARDKQWKIIRVSEQDNSFRYLLFDLSADISETKNLADAQPERVKQLAALLTQWEKPLAQPAWREGQMWENFQRLKHKMSVIGRAAERKLP